MMLAVILLFQILSGGAQVSQGVKAQATSPIVPPPAGVPWAGILDPSRAIDWRSAGFAIQEPANRCSNQTSTYTPSGGDDAATINALIAGCTGGGYILLGPGTFQLSSTGLLFNAVSNVVLRGYGTTQTKLVMSSSGINCLNGANYVCIYGNTNGPAGYPANGGGGAIWTGDNGVPGRYVKGDTVLDIGTIVGTGTCNSVATCFAIGQLIMLDQRNDGIGFPTTGTGCSESGTTVTCNTTLPHNLHVGDRVAVGGTLLTVGNSDCGSQQSGSTSTGYGGWWTVAAVPTTTSFQYTAATSGLTPCTGGHFNKDTGGISVFDVVPFTTENNNNYLGRACPNQGSPALLSPTCASAEVSLRGLQETHVITSVNAAANEITIDPPIFMNHFRSSQAPGISWTGSYPARYVVNDGIEDLTIDASAMTTRLNSTIAFINAYECWVLNTRIISSDLKRITMLASMRIDILNNYFFGSIATTNNNYAINPNAASSSNLIENNICDNLSACIVDEGSFGNVEAYNYAVASNYASGGWLPETLSHHGITGMNLLEGNNSPSLQADVWHGATWGMTVFRSRSRGQDVVHRTSNTRAVTVSAHNRGESIIGSVLGTTGTQTVYNGPAQGGSGEVFSLGFDEGTATNIPADPLVSQSLLRWGNYDVVSAAVRWNNVEVPTTAIPFIPGHAVPASQTLPPSFYRTSAPNFWQMATALGTGSPPWPPIGPDVTASGALDTTCAVTGLSGGSTTCDGEGHHAYQIPAQICWNHTGFDSAYQHTAAVVSGVWSSSGVVTLTLSTSQTIAQYEVITVSGMTPAAYNGMFQINAAVNGTTVTFPMPTNPGANGGTGTITWNNVKLYNPQGCYANATPTPPPIPPPAGITLTGVCPTGQLGSAYNCTLQATGGTSPYTFTEIGRRNAHRLAEHIRWEPRMPPGLTLTGALIHGTPTQIGTTQMTIQITDSSSPPQTATGILVIVINQLTRTATLPQEWANPHAADLPTSGVVTKYIHTDGSGDFPCNIQGLQASMDQWIATPPNTWWHVIIDDGLSTATGGRCLITSNTSFVLKPKTTGTPTGYIVYESAHPNAKNQTVCNHVAAANFNATGPSPRNPGCNTTPGIRDLQDHMWGIASSSNAGGGGVINGTGNPVMNIVIRDAEIYPLKGANTGGSQPVQFGGMGGALANGPTHIGLERSYLHADYDDNGRSLNQTPISNFIFFTCHLCWIEWNYFDRIARGTGSTVAGGTVLWNEGHVISMTNSYGVKIAHNFLEGGEIGVMAGGAIPALGEQNPPADNEVRANVWTMNPNWVVPSNTSLPSCGNTGTNARKNPFELKEMVRVLFSGNIFEYGVGCAQNGQGFTANVRAYSLDNHGATITDLTFVNNINRHIEKGIETASRSQGVGSGNYMSLPGRRWNFINNLMYDLAQQHFPKWSPGPTRALSGGATTAFNCDAHRDAAGATTTLTNCFPTTQVCTTTGGVTTCVGNLLTLQDVGDPTLVRNCADATFNTPPGALSPPALPGTNGIDRSFNTIALSRSAVVIYANPGVPNVSTTCQFLNGQGWESESIMSHNTYVYNTRINSYSPGGYGTPWCSRLRGYTIQNEMHIPDPAAVPYYVNNVCGQNAGAGLTNGFDSATFIFNHMLMPGAPASSFYEWDGQGNRTAANAPNATFWNPGNGGSVCPGATGTTTCIGVSGMMNGAPFMVNPPNTADPLVFYSLDPSSLYKAGGSRQASDGKDMGADMNAIRKAMQETMFSGCTPGACGPTGPYPD